MPNPEEQTIAVIGGAGYIGCHVVAQLLEAGYRVVVFDAFFFGPSVLDFARVRDSDDAQLRVVVGDICDTREIASLLRGCHGVIFLAAHTGHRVSDGCWTNLRATNFFAATTVLDAAVEHGVERFIFASTNSVYGVQCGVMYETSDPSPVSLYARLKLRMEERVLRRKRGDFHPTVLRLATCHGYSPRMRFDLITNSILRDAITQGKVSIASGEQWRSQMHVIDAARAICACLKAYPNLISGEVFNVGDSSQNTQIAGVAKAVIEAIPGTELAFFDTEQHLSDYRLSCSKLEKTLDFKPLHSLDESIEEIQLAFASGVFEDPYSLKYGEVWKTPARAS